jgi:hypothetical protein
MSSKPSDETETPPELFQALADRYAPGGFDLDAAASHENALADTYYTQDGYYVRDDSPGPHPEGVREVDVAQLSDANGLTGAWGWHTNVWVNPPYSDIRPWIEKAWREMAKPAGTRPRVIVMLLPARTDAPWWRELVEPFRTGGGMFGAGPESYPGSSDVTLDAEFGPRVHFLRNGRPIPATDPKTGEPIVNRNGRMRRGAPRFGTVVLVWRAPVEKEREVREVNGR